jgi:hypothetical protein
MENFLCANDPLLSDGLIHQKRAVEKHKMVRLRKKGKGKHTQEKKKKIDSFCRFVIIMAAHGFVPHFFFWRGVA